MKRLTLPFVFTKTLMPVVTFKLGDGREMAALVDSGSDGSIVDPSFREKYPEMVVASEHRGRALVFGIGGGRELDVENLTLVIPVKADDRSIVNMKLEAIVDKLSHMSEIFLDEIDGPKEVSLLLGSIDIQKMGAVIDYKKMTVILDFEEETQC